MHERGEEKRVVRRKGSRKMIRQMFAKAERKVLFHVNSSGEFSMILSWGGVFIRENKANAGFKTSPGDISFQQYFEQKPFERKQIRESAFPRRASCW